MKKIITVAILCLSMTVLASSMSLSAGTTDARESIEAARIKLVALLGTTDKGTQGVLIKEIHDASDNADKLLDAVIEDAGTSADVKTKVTDAKSTWEEFKATREKEIIPAILAGDVEKAKGLATGIQKERFKKIVSLLQ